MQVATQTNKLTPTTHWWSRYRTQILRHRTSNQRFHQKINHSQTIIITVKNHLHHNARLIRTCPVDRATGHSPIYHLIAFWLRRRISSCFRMSSVVSAVILHWDCFIKIAFWKTPCTFTKATPPLMSWPCKCPWVEFIEDVDRIPRECGDGGGGNIEGWGTDSDCWICWIDTNGGVWLEVLVNAAVGTGVPCGVPCWLGHDWLLTDIYGNAG